MAQRSSRSAAKTAPARAAAKSKKSSASDVEVAESSGGLGLDAGIGIVTALLLIGALVCTDKIQGLFGNGMFF
jgi:hypothetical protein